MPNTVSFVNYSDLLSHLQFTEEEELTLESLAWSNVSFGDADYTLVGNTFALNCILDAIAYGGAWEHLSGDEVLAVQNQVREKFWKFVGPQDYVNLEF